VGNFEEDLAMSNPPLETRFQKGVSGNPRGRPRGSISKKLIFERVCSERIKINDNGKIRKLHLRDAILQKLVRESAKGNVGFARILDGVEIHVDASGEPKDQGLLIVWPMYAGNRSEWKEQLARQQDELQRKAAELEASVIGGYEQKS
jgi:hypothetical protein